VGRAWLFLSMSRFSTEEVSAGMVLAGNGQYF
jgi:hypothetical protein